MKLASVWTSIVQVINILTFSSSDDAQSPLTLNTENDHPSVHNNQRPAGQHGQHGQHGPDPGPRIPVIQDASGTFRHGSKVLVQEYSSGMVYHPDDFKAVPLRTGGKESSFVYKDHPVIGTPKSPQEGVGGGLHCQYPTMKGWKPCYSPSDRSCWLRNDAQVIDIETDYEDPDAVPVGVVRRVRCFLFVC